MPRGQSVVLIPCGGESGKKKSRGLVSANATVPSNAKHPAKTAATAVRKLQRQINTPTSSSVGLFRVCSHFFTYRNTGNHRPNAPCAQPKANAAIRIGPLSLPGILNSRDECPGRGCSHDGFSWPVSRLFFPWASALAFFLWPCLIRVSFPSSAPSGDSTHQTISV